MPKISVIVPNYNHSLYLEQRIESILNQTCQDFELILLDDCSTDNSAQIIAKYQIHPKVSKVIINQSNSGSTFKQWQKGISEAQGEYIWIAESDDFADKNFLEVLLTQLDLHPELGLAYSQSYKVDEKGEVICSCKDIYPVISWDKVYKGKDIVLNYMAGANLIPNASAVVFRKEIADQIDSTYTHFRLSGDWWFWCEMLLRSDIIHICQELNYFRFHANKVTVSSAKKGLYFIEGLQILRLLKQKAGLPSTIYKNKSKNYARTFMHTHNINAAPVPSKSTVYRVLWQGLRINKVFVRRVFFLFLQQKLSKLKLIG
jgi:glycosyltransferase involved in cell wall biosynthesis